MPNQQEEIQEIRSNKISRPIFDGRKNSRLSQTTINHSATGKYAGKKSLTFASQTPICHKKQLADLPSQIFYFKNVEILLLINSGLVSLDGFSNMKYELLMSVIIISLIFNLAFASYNALPICNNCWFSFFFFLFFISFFIFFFFPSFFLFLFNFFNFFSCLFPGLLARCWWGYPQ